MAGPATTKLHTPPWPVLAGASLLLHVSIVSIGLPLMLRVGNPASGSNSPVTIPVALVDEPDETDVSSTAVDLADSPPSENSPPPKETLSPPVSEPSPASQLLPLGGKSPAAVEPTVTNAEQASTQAVKPTATTKTPVDAPDIPVPQADDSLNNAGGSATPNEADPGPPVSASGDPANSFAAANGPVDISIVGALPVPLDTRGDWPEILPTLNSTATVHIPGGHTCGTPLPAGEITLGLIIEADGHISDAFTANGDTATAQVASCLIRKAEGLWFTPAYNGEQPIPTDRMQLTVQFFSG